MRALRGDVRVLDLNAKRHDRKIGVVPGLIDALAVLEGLGGVAFFDQITSFEVGDRAGDLEDAVEGTRGEGEPPGREAEQLLGVGCESCLGVGADVHDRHVAVELCRLGEARGLQAAGGDHAFADGSGVLRAARLAGELFVVHPRHVDKQVDAVEERTGDALLVTCDDVRRAGTGAFGVAPEAAEAGGFRAAISEKVAGKVTAVRARLMLTTRSSSG